MPSISRNKCKKCNYEIILSGSWNFYRDKNGNIKSYGRTTPKSKKVRESGIYGHISNVYCDKCDKVVDIIITEYEVPYYKHCKEKRPKVNLLVRLKAWLSDDMFYDSTSVYIPKAKEIEIKCPKCNNKKIFFKSLENISCPRCNEGNFEEHYEHYF